MQHRHVRRGKVQLFGGQDVAVTQADVIFLIEKALALHTGHVQNIEVRQSTFQVAGLNVGDAAGLQYFIDDVIRHAQFFGADQDKLYVVIAGQALDEGMYRAAKLQVAAETNGQVVQTALAAADGHHVQQGLGGVAVAAVTGIDHRDLAVKGSAQRGPLFGVAHGGNIRIAADNADGIRNGFTLGSTGNTGIRETQHLAAQTQHRRFKRKAGAGGRLIEQCGQALVVSYILVCFGVIMDAVRKVQQLLGFFLCKVKGINQMSHQQPSFPYGVSENKENDGYFAKTSRM